MVITLLMVEITTFAKVQPMNRINAVVILQHLHKFNKGENHSRRKQGVHKPPTVFLVALGLNPRRERADKLHGEIERKQNEQKDFHLVFPLFFSFCTCIITKKIIKVKLAISTRFKGIFVQSVRRPGG
jgi:uncharacterized membrane protein YagU involved in acid resistance